MYNTFDRSAKRCYACGGTGEIEQTEGCPVCHGLGWNPEGLPEIKCWHCHGRRQIVTRKKCIACGGTGSVGKGSFPADRFATFPDISKRSCRHCNGEGIIKEERICGRCLGTGERTEKGYFPVISKTIVCLACNGKGVVIDEKKCAFCGGIGRQEF